MPFFSQFKDVPYVGYYKFLTPALVVRDPDLIKDIIIKDHSSFQKNDFHIDEKNDPLLSTNPFFSQGDPWKRGRVTLIPLFTASKVRFDSRIKIHTILIQFHFFLFSSIRLNNCIR